MNLNDRFKKFADSEYESIDDIQDIKFIGRKADYFAFERSWILEGNIQRKHIQGVWYIHEYKENNRRKIFSSFLMGPTANIESVKSLGNFLHMDWISYNGYAFIPSDLK